MVRWLAPRAWIGFRLTVLGNQIGEMPERTGKMNQQCKRVSRRIVRVVVTCVLAAGYGVGTWVAGATAKEPALKLYTDPEHVDADFQFQGEYAGTVSQPDGGKTRLGAQVRALGDGVFRTMFFAGGLPGDGWDGKTIIQKAPSTDDSTPEDAKLEGDKVVIDQVYKAACDGRTLAGQTDAGVKFELAAGPSPAARRWGPSRRPGRSCSSTARTRTSGRTAPS